MFATTYTEPIARGNHDLRVTLAKYLKEALPPIIDAMRYQYPDLDAVHLPYPVDYNCYDPMQQTDYPVIGAYVNSTEGWTRNERLKSGTTVFDSAYDVTIYNVSRTANLGQDESGYPDWEQPERESAMKLRDDLHAALRNALLSSPSLGTAGEEYRVVIDEESFTESFPDPIKAAQTNVYLCSGVISLTIMVRGAVAVPIYGPLEGVDSVVDKIDDTP